MSKAVLMSIQPKWCQLIIIGKKAIEIRKSRPKLETPFKVYIYCTKDKKYSGDAQGKVIGEFLCDKIYNYSTSEALKEHIEISDKDATDWSCLPKEKISDYEYSATGKENCINNIGVFLWHISDLVIYDTPKELSEFGKTRPPQSWYYVEETK